MKHHLNLGLIFFTLLLFSSPINALVWDNVAYWPLENSSELVKDVTGNGNDGFVFGNPQVNVEGKIGNSINFNYSKGHDNYVNTTDLDLNGSVTYSFWVFQKEGKDDTTYISKRDRWGGTTIEVYRSEQGIEFCIRTVSEKSQKGWTPLKHFFNTISRIFLKKDLKNYTFWGLSELEHSCVESEGNPPLYEWTHIVATYDESLQKMSLYLNGELNSSTNHFTGLPQNNKNYILGANAMGSEGYDGGKGGSEGAKERIDEIGIWNRVLSEKEIKELYNSGKGLTYLF